MPDNMLLSGIPPNERHPGYGLDQGLVTEDEVPFPKLDISTYPGNCSWTISYCDFY
jgi:hypothetical protein